jgi:hypothetical protein
MFQLALGPCSGDKAARQVKCMTVVLKEDEQIDKSNSSQELMLAYPTANWLGGRSF